MGESVNFTYLIILVAVCTLWFLLDYFYAPKHVPNEPPVVTQTIPYVGHIIGLLRHGLKYYEMTSARCKSPIHTLHMLNGKVYVVTSPDLVHAVSRNSKSLTFNPFIAAVGIRLTGADEATSSIIYDNLNGDSGHEGYVIDIHHGTVAVMAPGKQLNHMNSAMLDQVTEHLQALDRSTEAVELDLLSWVKHLLTICSTTAVYGLNNPFLMQPELEDAFWDFDRDLNALLVDVLPSMTARKGHKGRQKIASAFKQYFDNDPSRQSSALTNHRYNTNVRYGLTTLNMGRLEVGTLIGILANTIPTAFYMLAYIYSDELLLKDIRKELQAVISSVPDQESGQVMRYLNVSTMKEKCPLLRSTFQEVLRVHSLGASARMVLKDTMLNDQYLLKKGGVVQIPTSVIHSDTSVWGQTDFQPRRFLKQDASIKEEKRNPAAYRPFGGGSTLCPGRHFASTEILSLTAMMTLKYDVVPVSGRWLLPKPRQQSLATAVFPPENDVKVKITRNQCWGDCQWAFSMS